MSRVDGEPCFLLHLRPYRETSALLELLSLEHGRVAAVAKGLRSGGRGRQEWRAALQSFNLLALSWSGRGELKTLNDVQFQRQYRLQQRQLFCGFYLNELLERLLQRGDPQPEIFHHYQYCLAQLAAGEEEQRCLRRFEFSLLAALGYGFNLQQCASGEAVSDAACYRFDPSRGLLPASVKPGGEVAGELFLGEELLQIAEGDLTGSALLAARRLCRQALQPLLGGRELRSRALYAAVFASGGSVSE